MSAILFQYFLKAVYLISQIWFFFDLINCLYNLSLIFIECLIPLVNQHFFFFFFPTCFLQRGMFFKIFSKSLRIVSNPKLISVFPVAKDQHISSILILDLAITSVNDIFKVIFSCDKLGKMARNISCQITRNTLVLMIVEEYVIESF